MVMTRFNFRKVPFFSLLALFFGVVLLQGCAPKVVHVPGKGKYYSGKRVRGSKSGHAVVSTARSQIGRPYKWGGESPRDGFDCSGFVWWVFRQHGVTLPRVSWQQAGAGKAVRRGSLRAGDIVLFKVPGGGKSLHTGIYSGQNNFFIHSPKSGHHVREESMMSSYWRRYYIGARRVIR